MNIINNINNINLLSNEDIKLIFKLNDTNYNKILDVLKNNETINIIIIDQTIILNSKFISLINVLKNLHNLHKIIIKLKRKTDLNYINELHKLNNVKIDIAFNIKCINNYKNLTNFILNTNINKYIFNVFDKKDLKNIVNNSNLSKFKLKYYGNMVDDFFKIINENQNIKELDYLYIDIKNKIPLTNYKLNILLNNNTSINKLKLRQINFTNYLNKIDFCKSFYNNTNIKHLILKNCDHINEISDIFKYNKSIQTLEIYNKYDKFNSVYINNHDFSYFSINELLNNLSNNNTLEKLYINYNVNKIKTTGNYFINNNDIFNKFFLYNKTLKEIVILKCYITNIYGLIENLKNNNKLEYLHLMFNQEPNKINELLEVLNKNKTLKFWKIEIKTKNKNECYTNKE